MQVYKANKHYLREIENIYHIAVDHMISENNVNQWKHNNDKFTTQIIDYIDNNNFYVVKENNEIIGFFAMIFGIDKTYNEIDGKWINNDSYITIHKIASKYFQKGIASFMLNHAITTAKSNNIYNIRIDTHKDNISMKKFLERNGFIRCGIISITCNFNDKNSLRYAYLKQLDK